jgi:hypothetical protein
MACSPFLRELGQRIREAINSEEAYQILCDFRAKSWTTGGCQILAKSLKEWLGDVTPVFLVSENGYMHTVVRIDECYLDADGASTERQLLKRWKTARKVKRIELEDARWDPSYTEEFSEIIHRLVEILRKQIGQGM